MIPVPLYALLAAALAVVLTIGGASWRAYDLGAEHQSEVDKLASAEALKVETDRANEATRKLSLNVSQQETKDALNSNAIDDLSGKLRRLGRLRDPNARGCGPAPGGAARSASDCANHGAEAPGVLSAELAGLLQRLQREADDINNAYASCRTERWALQQELNKPRDDGKNR